MMIDVCLQFVASTLWIGSRPHAFLPPCVYFYVLLSLCLDLTWEPDYTKPCISCQASSGYPQSPNLQIPSAKGRTSEVTDVDATQSGDSGVRRLPPNPLGVTYDCGQLPSWCLQHSEQVVKQKAVGATTALCCQRS